MVCVGRPLLIWLDYNESVTTGFWSNPKIKVIMFLIGMGFGTSVCYSRIFLGVHSLDQVIFGAALGIWLSISFHLIVKDPLKKHVNDLLLVGLSKEIRAKQCLWILSLYAGFILISWLTYFLCSLRPFDISWEQMITEKCGIKNWDDFFLLGTLMEISRVNMIPGAYFGM